MNIEEDTMDLGDVCYFRMPSIELTRRQKSNISSVLSALLLASASDFAFSHCMLRYTAYIIYLYSKLGVLQDLKFFKGGTLVKESLNNLSSCTLNMACKAEISSN